MNETFVATDTTNVAIPTCRPAFATSLAHLDKRYIATCTATAYLCFRQYDTPHVNE